MSECLFQLCCVLQVLVLRNHGVLVGGQSIEEAFYLARNLLTALDVQVRRNNITVLHSVQCTASQQRLAVHAALMRLIGRLLSSVHGRSLRSHTPELTVTTYTTSPVFDTQV